MVLPASVVKNEDNETIIFYSFFPVVFSGSICLPLYH